MLFRSVEKAGRLVGQNRHAHIQQRHVDVLAFAGAVAHFHRREDGAGGIDTGKHIGNGHARALRAAAGHTTEVTYLGAHVVPPEYAADPDGYVDLVRGPMLDACAPHALTAFQRMQDARASALGAASYDGPKVTGTGSDKLTQTERLATTPDPSGGAERRSPIRRVCGRQAPAGSETGAPGEVHRADGRDVFA